MLDDFSMERCQTARVDSPVLILQNRSIYCIYQEPIPQSAQMDVSVITLNLSSARLISLVLSPASGCRSADEPEGDLSRSRVCAPASFFAALQSGVGVRAWKFAL